MQKIGSLLAFLLVGQTVFAGKNAKHQYTVEDRLGLMTAMQQENKMQKQYQKDPAFGVLIDTCKKLTQENKMLKKLLMEQEKQEQQSSNESSPVSIIAISPIEQGGLADLLPRFICLESPEAQIVKSPVLSSVDKDCNYLESPEVQVVRSPVLSSYEYPGSGRFAVVTTPGFADDSVYSLIVPDYQEYIDFP